MFSKNILLSFILIFFMFSVSYAEIDQQKMMKKIVTAMEITGNDLINTKDIITQAGLKTVITGRVFAHDLYTDIISIYSLGYFKEVTVDLEPYKIGAKVIFKVKENEVIDNIKFDGVTAINKNKLKKALKNKEKKVLNNVFVEDDIKTINEYYLSRGYELARVSSVEFDQTNKILKFNVDEGHIEEVSIEGNTKTKAYVIERAIKSKKGDVYNSIKLSKDRDRIFKLGYFSQVFSPQLSSGTITNNIKVKFRLIERRVNSISGGIEQQENGVGIFANLNLVNFIGTGELFSLKGQYGRDKTYLVRYYNPWLFNLAPVSLDTSFYLKQETSYVRTFNKNISVRRLGWDLGFIFPLKDTMLLDIKYKSEGVREINGTDLTPYDIKSIKGIISIDKRDSKINPTKGSVVILSLEKSFKGISYSRYMGQGNVYFKLTRNLVFAGRITTGVFHSPSSGQVILDAEAFEVGGSTSLRGISENNPLIGTKKFVLNSELRYQVNRFLGGVLFYDTGNAYSGSLNLKDIKGAVGTGLRVNTPIGPLRFDFAWGWQAFNFHFGIGQMF